MDYTRYKDYRSRVTSFSFISLFWQVWIESEGRRFEGKREWWEVEEVSFQDVRGEVRRIKRDARTKCQKS